MKTSERVALWILVVATALGLIVLGIVIAAELAQINDTLAALGAGKLSDLKPTASDQLDNPLEGSATADIDATVTDLYVLTDTVALTITVHACGAGDLLFEPPLLTNGPQQLPITNDSLEDARWAFLDLVTAGTATAPLEFAGSLELTESLWVVFNPGQEPGNSLAPQVWVELQLQQEGDEAGE